MYKSITLYVLLKFRSDLCKQNKRKYQIFFFVIIFKDFGVMYSKIQYFRHLLTNFVSFFNFKLVLITSLNIKMILHLLLKIICQ